MTSEALFLQEMKNTGRIVQIMDNDYGVQNYLVRLDFIKTRIMQLSFSGSSVD